jgi:hypothetical protein
MAKGTAMESCLAAPTTNKTEMKHMVTLLESTGILKVTLKRME